LPFSAAYVVHIIDVRRSWSSDLLDVGDEIIAADYALSDGVVDDGERAQTIHYLPSLVRKERIPTRDMLIKAGVSALYIRELQRLFLEAAART
jgi:hypothetical protein